jgi:hypothetical protein
MQPGCAALRGANPRSATISTTRFTMTIRAAEVGHSGMQSCPVNVVVI